MKLKTTILLGAALLGCLSCVEANYQIGSNLIPLDQQFDIYHAEIPIENIEMRMADSLSGYSSTKICIGAIRDELYGLTSRECALTLVPLYDTLDWGNVQKINSFKLRAVFDTVSVSKNENKHILQRVFVNELNPVEDIKKLTDANDCAGLISHGSESIVKGSPLIDGSKDLELNFTEDYARKFLERSQGMVLSKDMDEFLQQLPGIYLSTESPSTEGGRINIFNLQMDYNSTSYYLQDNFGEINITSTFDEETGPVDTTFFFFYGELEYHNVDSLAINYSTGTFPQYAINLTKHSTRDKAGAALDKVYVEGGAGLKPVIPASELRSLALRCIGDTLAANGRSIDESNKAFINKASIVLPFDAPNSWEELDNFFPPRLSPVCKIKTDTTASYMGLADSSNSKGDQGDIDRSNLLYSPDISYHLQQLIMAEDDNENLVKGNYDVWMLLMNIETTTSSNSNSSSDMNEYLQYLAYQSYYNSMYGYGSSYGNSYYNNYYSYMMAAMYASGSSTTTTSDYELDKDCFYRAVLCGPQSSSRKPVLKITFSLPRD